MQKPFYSIEVACDGRLLLQGCRSAVQRLIGQTPVSAMGGMSGKRALPCSVCTVHRTCAYSCRTQRRASSPCICGTPWPRQSSLPREGAFPSCWQHHGRSRPCSCCIARPHWSCCGRSLRRACWSNSGDTLSTPPWDSARHTR